MTLLLSCQGRRVLAQPIRPQLTISRTLCVTRQRLQDTKSSLACTKERTDWHTRFRVNTLVLAQLRSITDLELFQFIPTLELLQER